MHRKAVTLTFLLASAAAVGASLVPEARLNLAQRAAATEKAMPQRAQLPPAPPSYADSVRITAAVERWHTLRQTDGLPFSSYASFLMNHRGWPGETAMRRTAERAINPQSTPAGDVIAYFNVHPPLSAAGHARYAFALLSAGHIEDARAAARRAWLTGAMPEQDEQRLLTLFGAVLTPQDHDRRMEALLASGSLESARRTLGFASAARRPIYDARIALQSNAPDAASKLAAIGSAADVEADILIDRANWLNNSGQPAAARALLAQARPLSSRPHDPEKWFETLLLLARGAASDRNWLQAYQIASRLDEAYERGTAVSQRSMGERDDYTSLAWLAGTTALHQLARPADAVTMFVRYARGGRSTQVLSKGLYWAGRAAQAAGQANQATAYFTEAAADPSLFYAQLALERLGRPVPPPQERPPISLTDADRTSFAAKDLAQATRLLGQLGRWTDQSLFIRALAEQATSDKERILALELSHSIGRPDLAVWIARTTRNDGSIFYYRPAYPEANIPPAQSHYWTLANAIIRQESSFDRAAISHAGACGLMQLMPGTARDTARKMGLPYDFGRLTSDPEYNIMLGSQYFASLMDQWGGYAPLAIASYNAGPGNVRRWINQNGDPRLPSVDVVRWIEEIPFSETKGYVQRVLENAVVYDAIYPQRARSPERARLSYHLGKSNEPG